MQQILSIILAVGYAYAQFSPLVTYDTVFKSPIDANITISYRIPDANTCRTSFPTQKQYTGYINLPPYTLQPYQQDYSINTFFWFFEARHAPETAPLTIWLNGGPGSSSMIGLFREAGPCEVVQYSDGTYGTQSSLYGWDRSSNLLFIDQPTQVGFSYDEPRNQTLNLYTRSLADPHPASGDSPPWLFLNGTFSSGNVKHTQNTSIIAASASWHFLQGFLSAFPQYNPGTRPNSTSTGPTGINLFAESYGGQYGPAFADHFEKQNAKRRSGALPLNTTLEIKLVSLGIINGLVDELIQAPSWANFLYNNTYGIQSIDQVAQLNALSDFNSTGGCRDMILRCRDSLKLNDPTGEGDEEATNFLCLQAKQNCDALFFSLAGEINVYDIRARNPSSFPGYAYLEYLNNATVQISIGAKVNFTESSAEVYDAFQNTGDEIRGTQLLSLASLLSEGIKIALIYGDADWICNWYGGEAVSLALASNVPAYTTTFPAAGYADIITNDSYIGGQVRQFGNLSFARIYDAGHTVPSYQPQTAFTVFDRIISGNDIGTGKDIDLSTFGTRGPAFSNFASKATQQPDSVCWIRAIVDTCTPDQSNGIRNGTGVVKNGIWYAEDDPKASSTPGLTNGAPPAASITTSGVPLTGVYTATGTPQPNGASSPRRCWLRRDVSLSQQHTSPVELHSRSRWSRLVWVVVLVSFLGALLILTLLICLGLLCWRFYYTRRHGRPFLRGFNDDTLCRQPTEASMDNVRAFNVTDDKNWRRREGFSLGSIIVMVVAIATGAAIFMGNLVQVLNFLESHIYPSETKKV